MAGYEWIEMSDIKLISQKLIEKYPEKFGHVILEKVSFIGVMNKKRANENVKIWSLQAVADPLNLFFGTDVVVMVLLDYWSNMDIKNQNLVTACILDCLAYKERMVIKGYDVKDSRLMISNFGIDYESDSNVPDIINTNFYWR